MILLLSIFISACNHTPEKKKKVKQEKEIPTYTIGVNMTLSGNGSYFSEEIKKGLDLSFDYTNERSDKVILNIIYEDNKLNPKDAVSISRKFIDIDNVDIIISGFTPIIQATIGMIDRAGIPMLVTLSSVENIASDHDWAFRDFELEMETMPLLASYAYSGMDLKKGSWLVVNDDMGTDVVKFFSDKFIEQGGEMTEGEVFDPTEMDLRNKINKIMEHGPEFIIVAGRGATMINAIRQLRERDMDIPVICNNTVDNDKVWQALGEKGNHILFPRPYTDFMSDRYMKVNERFRLKYGSDLNWLNTYGISIANYVTRGLIASGDSKEAMRDFLKTLNAQSIRGMLVMDANSDVKTPHTIFRRMNNVSTAVEINEQLMETTN
ncbi:MAG: ABC transporter substrate-binding protein [Bacteroidota bacterium]